MLQLKQRQVPEESTENWDDDDFDIGGDSDFMFPTRATSVATTATRDSFSASTSHHRDSFSASVSRLSIRSDFGDDDEDRQFQAPADDEKSKNDAIAAATRAGIPIPQNIPASALMGGTIKRLGGRKVKKIIQQDDWDDDLEFPRLGQGGLTLKRHDPSEYPDMLRHVSGPNSTASSPFKKLDPAIEMPGEDEEFDQYATIKPTKQRQHVNLDMFKDDDDDDFFGGRGGDTLKVSKKRLPRPVTVILPPTPVKNELKPETNDDDFASDFQLPSDNKPLRLSMGRDIPKTPAPEQDEFDEWGEGSLGTRYGGTRRSGVGRSNSKSARSSSASAMSPSIASSATYESEDDGLDGLVLPTGPMNFGDILKRRQQMELSEYQAAPAAATMAAPASPQELKPTPKRPAPPARLSSRDDFLAGLDLGDGEVFDSNKLTLNRNVKIKTVRQTSPQRPKASASLKFTDKPATVSSRLPRPLGHERHSSNLDPVCETGATSGRIQRTKSRLGGFHTPHTSISGIPTPPTPTSSTSALPTTPRRRGIDQKPSLGTLRGIINAPTTTSAQLLKVKRSMPVISNTSSPARPMSNRFERPPSRDDPNAASSRPSSMARDSRAKTPTERERERQGAESSMGSLRSRQPPPFLPGGSSSGQSHHVAIKTSRHFRQNDSMSSNVSGVSTEGYRSTSRTMSRAGLRSPSPATKTYATGGSLRLRGPEALAREAASKRQITKPTKKQHFGDGRELDGFDDLPTSSSVEQKYVKEPVGRGPPRSLRNKVYQTPATSRTPAVAKLESAFSPKSPQRSPQRNENRSSYDNLPSFARPTNASRMAREQVLSQRTPSSGGPLTSLTNQWKAQVTAKTGLQPAGSNMTPRPKKTRQTVQKRPHLIKPMNDVAKTAKSVKGMTYNPTTFRWEGNENDPMLSPFDLPAPVTVIPDPAATPPPHVFREKENTTPRPALITNINASQGVQIVGGMVFDPQRMCWLKVPSKRGQSLTHQSLSAGDKDTLDGFEAFGADEDDEDDVFKDVPDLEDRPRDISPMGQKDDSRSSKPRKSGFTDGAGGGLKDDWLVGEEFDVGPEFVRRQREEEERWRRKVEKWVGEDRQRIDSNGWRWRIRDVVNEL